MKKIKSQLTLSNRLKKAIDKDLSDIYHDAAYGTLDYHGALDTLNELGYCALYRTWDILKELDDNET